MENLCTYTASKTSPNAWLIFEHQTGAIDGIYHDNPINDPGAILQRWRERRPQYSHSILYLAEGSELDTFDCRFLPDLYYGAWGQEA